MAFVRGGGGGGGVDAVKAGTKLNLIKKIWGKRVGGGSPTTLTVSSLVSEFCQRI